MIRFALADDVLSLKNIWDVCFGDSDFYISSYYQNRPSDTRSLIWEEDGSIVSMLDLIPVTLLQNGKDHQALYIYAAATLPDFQGNRIMTQLIEAAAKWATENDYDFLGLIPQDESLIEFYQPKGFVLPVYRDFITIVQGNSFATEQVRPCSEGRFQEGKLRYENTFSDVILHSESFCRCLYRQTLVGGSILSVGDRYAICYLLEDSKLFVQEISSDEEQLEADVNAICRYYHVKSATVARQGTKQLYGLFRPLHDDCPDSVASVYMNTMLD